MFFPFRKEPSCSHRLLYVQHLELKGVYISVRFSPNTDNLTPESEFHVRLFLDLGVRFPTKELNGLSSLNPLSVFEQERKHPFEREADCE